MGKQILSSENQDAIVLSPTEMSELIVGLYNQGPDVFHRTPVMRGAPGIGKSSITKQAYERLKHTRPDFLWIELNPTMPADEIGGIPDLVRTPGQPTRTEYAMPSWFPMDPEAEGILNLDDCLQGDNATQLVLANLLQARNLRGVPLPKGIMIVGSGNRSTDNAGSRKMLSHLGDRVTLFDIEANAADWIEDFALPNGIDDRVISYITQHEEKLNMFNPKVEKCATSRTWAAVSSKMNFIDSLKGTKNYEKFAQAILVGELGMAEGALFWNHSTMIDQIPDIDAALADPMTAAIPADVDVQFATCVKIAKVLNEETFANALTYVERMAADLTAMTIKLAARSKPELQDTDTFATWAVKNQELLHNIPTEQAA